VHYLVTASHGDITKIGYIPSGFSGGLSLGRLLLVKPTHQFGEFKMLLLYMLLLYMLLCFGKQLVFWLVPNIVSSAVTFSLMGFFLGPFFVAVSQPQISQA